MAAPAPAMSALSTLFGVALDVPAVVAGPAFTRHSKFGNDFGAAERVAEQQQAAPAHADEIEKVVAWAEAVAGLRWRADGSAGPSDRLRLLAWQRTVTAG